MSGGGAADCRWVCAGSLTAAFPCYACGQAVVKQSMNFEKRRQEAERIAKENTTFLGRIVTQKPNLSAEKMEEEFQKSA